MKEASKRDKATMGMGERAAKGWGEAHFCGNGYACKEISLLPKKDEKICEKVLDKW